MRDSLKPCLVFLVGFALKSSIAFRVPRPASRDLTISTTLRQPVGVTNNLRGQLDATFSDLEAFAVNATFPTDDVEVTAGCFRSKEPAFKIDGFFKTAESAAMARLFPCCHCCGRTSRICS